MEFCFCVYTSSCKPVEPVYILTQPLVSFYSTRGAKVASCFFSNTCLGLGVTVLSRLEALQEGLSWRNANTPLSMDDDFHMSYVYMMLLIDTLLYFFIAWYVNWQSWYIYVGDGGY